MLLMEENNEAILFYKHSVATFNLTCIYNPNNHILNKTNHATHSSMQITLNM